MHTFPEKESDEGWALVPGNAAEVETKRNQKPLTFCQGASAPPPSLRSLHRHSSVKTVKGPFVLSCLT